MKEFYQKYKGEILIGYGVFCVVALLFSMADKKSNTEVRGESSSRQSFQQISSEVFSMSADTVRATGKDDVKDVHGSQDGQDVTLAVVVQRNVSKERARSLGDVFIRQVISNSMAIQKGVEEASLSKSIGPTVLNYRLIIGYGPDEVIADGIKQSYDEDVNWHD